jgi:hypothetical protein
MLCVRVELTREWRTYPHGELQPMLRFPHTHLPGLLLRLAMIALCLWPFSGPRQVAGTFGFSLPPIALAQVPNAPSNEEEESEAAEDGKNAKNRVASASEFRPEVPPVGFWLPFVSAPAPIRVTSSACPSPADPFRNGLGSPYRC